MRSQQQAMTTLIASPDRAAQPVTQTATPRTRADAPCAWRAAALAAYTLEAGVDGAYLRAELATRVRTLTGCVIPESMITVDRAARRATGAMEGVVFQLQRHNLILLRPCAYCGMGLFESAPLSSLTDLGYALSDWQPYHRGCEPGDTGEIESW
jgi:hypothetical protein